METQTRQRIEAIGDALSEVQRRFADANPPIRSWHLSGPYQGPALRTGKTRLWFLVDDDDAVARGATMLTDLERAVAEALAASGHPEAELAPLVLALDTVSQHAACAVRSESMHVS